MRTPRGVACGLLVIALAGCGEPRRTPGGAADDAGTRTAEPAPGPPPAGFAASSARRQRTLERQFLAVPSPDAVDATIRELSAIPHMSGTPGGAQIAAILVERLGALGFEVETETYDVYLPHPRTSRVRVLGKTPRDLATREPATRAVPDDAPELALWSAYSASKTVRAPVVYAGNGMAADYEALAAAKVDVRGKVVLLRYGPLYRGAQVALAEQRGAAGVIFHVDPPDGLDRPLDAVQRGTVVYYWKYTGDPLTPGRPARPGEPRLAPADAEVLPRIPVTTITAGDARGLLAELGGPAAPAAMAGRLDVPYRLGPGPRVELAVELDGETRPIRNVIATLRGDSPRTVVLGNHHDAWILGALDPHSGSAVLLEIARGLAALRDGGWRPRRTIVLAFWDAEEFGVIGSTEHVEDHLRALQERAVAYLNVDTVKAGTLLVQGSQSLRDLVIGAADDVVDPATGESLGAGWRARARAAWDEAHPGDAAGFELRLADIGIGADWTAFLHHAGVPSLQWQTSGGPGVYQVWHAVRDDHAYARTHADPDFRFLPLFARAMGLAALRLAEADALPFRYAALAGQLDRQLDALVASAPPGAVDQARLRAAIARLREAAEAAEAAQERALAAGDAAALARLDAGLPAVEQAFLADDGVAGRPWYRHLLNAANTSNGYASLPLPELAEALASGASADVARATLRLEAVLHRAADRLTALIGDAPAAAPAAVPTAAIVPIATATSARHGNAPWRALLGGRWCPATRAAGAQRLTVDFLAALPVTGVAVRIDGGKQGAGGAAARIELRDLLGGVLASADAASGDNLLNLSGPAVWRAVVTLPERSTACVAGLTLHTAAGPVPLAMVDEPSRAALATEAPAILRALSRCRVDELAELVSFPLEVQYGSDDDSDRSVERIRDARALVGDSCTTATNMDRCVATVVAPDEATCSDNWENMLGGYGATLTLRWRDGRWRLARVTHFGGH